MLIQFVYSLSIVLVLILSVLHINRISFIKGFAEQASFFAARSLLVKQDPNQSIATLSCMLLSTFDSHCFENSSSHQHSIQWNTRQLNSNIKTSQVSLPYVSLAPNFDFLFFPLFNQKIVLQGSTPIPLVP